MVVGYRFDEASIGLNTWVRPIFQSSLFHNLNSTDNAFLELLIFPAPCWLKRTIEISFDEIALNSVVFVALLFGLVVAWWRAARKIVKCFILILIDRSTMLSKCAADILHFCLNFGIRLSLDDARQRIEIGVTYNINEQNGDRSVCWGSGARA